MCRRTTPNAAKTIETSANLVHDAMCALECREADFARRLLLAAAVLSKTAPHELARRYGEEIQRVVDDQSAYGDSNELFQLVIGGDMMARLLA